MKKIIQNMAWLFTDRILRLFVAFFVNIFVARTLGAQNFGELNYILAFVTLFSPLAAFGLEQIAVRELVDAKDNSRDLSQKWSILFYIKIFASFLSFILAWIFNWVLGTHYSISLFALLSISLLFQFSEVFEYFFQSRTQARSIVIAKNLSFILGSFLKIYGAYTRQSLIFFGALYGLESLVSFLGLLWMFKKESIHSKIALLQPQYLNQKHWAFAKKILKECTPMIAAGAAITIYMRLDQVILGNILTKSDVGVYSIAVKFSEIWYMVPTVFVASIFPTLLTDRHQNPHLFLKKIQNAQCGLAFISYVIGFLISFSCPYWLPVLYGTQFISSVKLLQIHIWTGIFVFQSVAVQAFLVAHKMTKMTFTFTFLGAAINIALNLYWIPLYGAQGSAWATLIAQAFSGYFLLFIFKSTRPLFYTQTKAYTLVGLFDFLKQLKNKSQLT